MPRSIPLDKILVQGIEYETDVREVWVIKKCGTNSTSAGSISIDKKPTTTINSTVAPLHKTSSNFLGPLDLKDLYNVVLPETKIEWTGASGSKLRVVGTKIELDSGEAIESALKSRYDVQHKNYVTTIENTYSHGTDTAWAADLEKEVVSLTPKTTEKYLFDSIILASISNVSGGVAEGDWAIRFYHQNAPLEFLVGPNIRHGIDILSIPRPPAEATEFVPFTLEAFPLLLEGDRTLSVRCANVSGASKSPTTGASITVTCSLIAKYSIT